MKKLSTTWFVIFLCALSQAMAAESKSDATIPRGALNLNGTSVNQSLTLYALYTGKKLVTSSHALNLTTTIILQPDVELKESQAIALLEKALREQAGVVMTRLDDQRISVTYNDALPITVVTNGRPIPLPITKDGKEITPPTFPLKELGK
jgi:hypothetical protein